MKKDVHSRKPRFQTMLQEYPLLTLRPSDVIRQRLHLHSLTIRDRIKVVQQCSNCPPHQQRNPIFDVELDNVLSLAVLAFAVEDINERERVMTSASPCAFLPYHTISSPEHIQWFLHTLYPGKALRASQEHFPDLSDPAPGHYP